MKNKILGLDPLIFKAVLSKEKANIHYINHIGNRVSFPTKDYALITIPDFSRFCIDFNKDIIKNSTKYYYGEELEILELEKGIILVNLEKALSTRIIQEGIDSGKEFLSKIIFEEINRRLILSTNTVDLEQREEKLTPKDLEKQYNLMLEYNGLRIDDLIPLWYLDEKLDMVKDGNNLRSILLTPQTSHPNYLERINSNIEKLTLLKRTNLLSLEKINQFIIKHAYITISDIKQSKWEDYEFINHQIISSEFTDSILKRIDENQLRKRIMIHEYSVAVSKFINSALTSLESNRRKDLLEYIKLGINFNEYNREYRTRTFRLFRHHYIKHFADPFDVKRENLYEVISNA